MAFKSSLSYTGIAQPTPPNQVINDKRAPTANDYNYNIGDRWIVPTRGTAPSQQEWVLMSKPQNVAVWVQVNAAGATTYNNHELLVGTGTATVNTINNSTAGLPLLTQGAGADPAWGVLQVPAGGTGASLFVADSIVIGGATSTSDLTSVASVGVAGQVLHSQGAGLPPIWLGTGPIGAITNINVQYFTTPGAGTYTPTAGMVQCMVECVGGGGGSYGTWTTLNTDVTISGGGAGGGGYSKALFTSATIGASQALVVGAGGIGGVAVVVGPGASGSDAGTDGSATTFGAFLVANGGNKNQTGGNLAGIGGTSTGGDINVFGSDGTRGFVASLSGGTVVFPGSGGSSGNYYGPGGASNGIASGLYAYQSNPGKGYGGGASGVGLVTQSSPQVLVDGSAGSDGIIIITEYIQ